MAVFVSLAAFLCLFFSGFDVVRGDGYFQIMCNGVECPPVVYLQGDSIKLICNYFTSAPNAASYGDAEWVKVEGTKVVVLNSTAPAILSSTTMQINVTVTSIGKYACRYKTVSITPAIVVVDEYHTTDTTTEETTTLPVGHTTDGVTNPPPPVNHATSGGVTGPAVIDDTLPPSDSGTDSPTSFKALNPVIYTVVSAAILGTLTIVAIVTCWLRSRKNIHLQTLLPRNSPQDYLDFIQENEFTPMTTSEFLASLQERPPTYNESETIERQKRETDGENSGEAEGGNGGQHRQPPPLPPRNNPRRSATRQPDSSSTLTQSVSFQHQQQSCSDGRNSSSSTSLSAQVQQERRHSYNTQGTQRSRPTDMHMDAVLAAFVESIEILEAQRAAFSPPSDRDSDEDETSVQNSSETAALLVRVVPSLDPVV